MILIRICVMDNVAMSLSLSLKKQIDPVMVTSVAVVGNLTVVTKEGQLKLNNVLFFFMQLRGVGMQQVHMHLLALVTVPGTKYLQ